jgi:aminopeptidase YwaD
MTSQTVSGAGGFLSLAKSCLETTERLLHKYRYRIAGTPECRQAAHEIANHFRKSCDNVQEEVFLLHPKALWYVGKVIAVNYLLTAAFLTLGGYFCYLGAILCILGLSYGLAQYVFYGRIFDRAFKSAGGCNVVGSIEPRGVATQQIVLVGHHDSPFIFSFLERFQRIAFIRFLLGILSYAWLCVYSFAASIQQLLSIGLQAPTGIPLWTTIAGLPFALQLFFMMSSAKSPGAGDNLNSTSMVATIAQYYNSERSKAIPLKHTRLILLSTDGEEIGQRGAIQYVQDHYPQLHDTSTFVLNIDSVYHYRDLTVLTRDRNFTCKLSDSMISDICMVASDCGISLKRRPIPFGGGGTDAAAFAVAGIKATSIVGMPTGFISRDHIYHTSNDTVEHIEAVAVGAVLEIAAGYIRMVDNQAKE